MCMKTLCVTADFDTRLCKIRRVALLVDDDDVANKRFVQQSMQILRDRQNEIENKLDTLQSSTTISLNYVQQSLQTFKDQLNLIEMKLTLQNSMQLKMTHHPE